MNVVVIGSNGQLGVDICEVLNHEGHHVVALTHSDIELADDSSIAAAFEASHPDIVVNTAAMHNVEQCESDPSRAFAINAVGVRNLARRCNAAGVYLLHIGTDYVFDGLKTSPYLEADLPCPLNVYGSSKLAGEHFVLNSCRNGAVLRVSGVYGSHPCRAKGGMNFVQLMLKLATDRPEIRVVDDEILTPTYTVDIARQVALLVTRQTEGVIHGTAQGACSWYQFAAKVFELSGMKVNLQKARPGEFPAKVLRPRYSVLENGVLARNGIDIMPSWEDGLARYLKVG